MIIKLWCWLWGHDIWIKIRAPEHDYDESHTVTYRILMRTNCCRCGEPNKYFAQWKEKYDQIHSSDKKE